MRNSTESAFAFGFGWSSDLPLPLFHQASSLTDAIVVRQVEALAGRTLEPETPGRHVVQAADGFRYRDVDGSVLDAFASGRVDACLPRAQEVQLPASFYGTVTGLLLALRGVVPLHGSAVEIGGQAVLICGSSGAGKSTAAAALIAAGAKLISDDLSVLHLLGGVPHLFAGRRTIRLFGDVAGFLGERVKFLGDSAVADGKLAVLPPHSDPARGVQLATVLVLGGPHAQPEKTLAAQFFRPARLRELPGHRQRLAAIAIAASQMRILVGEPVEARSRDSFAEAGKRLLEKVRS